MKLQKFATDHLIVAWYRVQARVGITLAEARALVTLSILLLFGTAVQEVGRFVRGSAVEQSPSVVFLADSVAQPSLSNPEAELPAETSSMVASAVDSVGNMCVDLNKSTSEQLRRLPGVGPALASRIIEYRLRYGGFSDATEITAVSGIGPRTLDRISRMLCGSENGR